MLSRKSVWRAAQHCKQVSHSAEESLIKIQHIHRFLKQDTRKSRCSEICAFKEICLACCTTLQAGISLRRRIFNKNPTHSSLQTAPASKASKYLTRGSGISQEHAYYYAMVQRMPTTVRRAHTVRVRRVGLHRRGHRRRPCCERACLHVAQFATGACDKVRGSDCG